MTTPPLPPPDSFPFIAESTEMSEDRPRPQSVTIAVGLAWAVVAIGLLGELYFNMNSRHDKPSPISPEQMWWILYRWIITGAILLASLGTWMRNAVARVGLTVVLGVSVAVGVWGLSQTLMNIVRYPNILSNLSFLVSFSILGIVPFALRIIALVLISTPSSRSWFDRSLR